LTKFIEKIRATLTLQIPEADDRNFSAKNRQRCAAAAAAK